MPPPLANLPSWSTQEGTVYSKPCLPFVLVVLYRGELGLSTTGEVVIIVPQRTNLHHGPGLSHPSYWVSLIQCPAIPCCVAYVHVLLLNRRAPASVLLLTTSQAHVWKCLWVEFFFFKWTVTLCKDHGNTKYLGNQKRLRVKAGKGPGKMGRREEGRWGGSQQCHFQLFLLVWIPVVFARVFFFPKNEIYSVNQIVIL